VSKSAIIRSGQPFVGQTEFLADLAGEVQPVMMLLGTDDRGRWLRVALATTHVPIRRLAEGLTREQVRIAIVRAAQACRDLGLARARVGVCGLNPHAGEGGELGTEEITTIGPAVQDVVGPLAADALFYHALHSQYDAVVAMFHDQGLAPLKLVAFASGVNWTLGLPFIRTSPDHGTAFALAGTGQADAGSMAAALLTAADMVRHEQKK
jgi:4-hydroxythreonine-4-phosphate dehydrogenase